LLLRKLLLPVDDEGLLAAHKRLEKLHSAVFVVDVKAPDVLFFGRFYFLSDVADLEKLRRE